jgi:hypothetical protein
MPAVTLEPNETVIESDESADAEYAQNSQIPFTPFILVFQDNVYPSEIETVDGLPFTKTHAIIISLVFVVVRDALREVTVAAVATALPSSEGDGPMFGRVKGCPMVDRI